MSKEKQIEEMAKTLCGEKEKRCENCDSYRSCEFWIEASILHNQGYRKQSEGVWKFNKDGSGTCSECRSTQKNVWDDDHHQNYCGVCGAKMKGGAE